METGNGVLPEVTRMLISIAARSGRKLARSAHAPAATRSASTRSFSSTEPPRFTPVLARKPSPVRSPTRPSTALSRSIRSGSIARPLGGRRPRQGHPLTLPLAQHAHTRAGGGLVALPHLRAQLAERNRRLLDLGEARPSGPLGAAH